jgi:pre-mRNA-splicing factor SPF27
MINVCADEPPAPANTAIDLDRYNFSVTEDLLHSTDPTRWSEAVDRLKGKLEYERDGLLNLELLQKFGGNAWKIHNYQLESQVELLDRLFDEAKDSMQQVNKRRKVEQLKSGKELMRLTQQWQELVESKRQVQLENERLLSIALQQQSANQ